MFSPVLVVVIRLERCFQFVQKIKKKQTKKKKNKKKKKKKRQKNKNGYPEKKGSTKKRRFGQPCESKKHIVKMFLSFSINCRTPSQTFKIDPGCSMKAYTSPFLTCTAQCVCVWGGGGGGGGGVAGRGEKEREGAPVNSRFEGRRTVFMSSLRMTRRKACSDTESPSPTSGVDPCTLSCRGRYTHHLATTLQKGRSLIRSYSVCYSASNIYIFKHSL